MAQVFLWVNKDASSLALSRSSRVDESRIRRHVQEKHAGPRTSAIKISSVVPTIAQRSTRSPSEGPPGDYQPVSSVNRRRKAIREAGFKTANSCRTTRQDRLRRLHEDYLDLCSRHPRQVQLALTDHELHSDERRSLSFFFHRTSREWPGWRDATFWNTLALQACHHSEAVSHGLISISALHESLEATTGTEQRRAMRQLSLAQWNKAMQAGSVNGVSHFEALVSCVILACLQNFHIGGKAYQLLRCGAMMLDEVANQDHVHGSVPASQRERSLIEQHLRPLIGRLRMRSCTMADPAAAFEASVRLRRTRSLGNPATPDLPTNFSTLLEARNCLEAIFTWGRDNVPDDQWPVTVGRSFQATLRWLCNNWTSALDRLPAEEPGFTPLVSRKPRMLLKVACLIGRIIIETFATVSEMVYDKYLPEFRDIVQIVEEVSGAIDPAAENLSFGIDGGLLDILAFVGNRCRDPETRRRALTVMTSSQRVEGDRVGSVAGSIVKALVELEEKDLIVTSCQDIPERHRRRLLQGIPYYDLGKICLVYAGPPYDPVLGAVVKKVWLPLRCCGPRVLSGTDFGYETPDFVYGRGYADVLEDRETQRYFRVDLEEFYFPIPRV